MEKEKCGFDLGEDSEGIPNIELKGRSRDFFSLGKGFGNEKPKSFEFFENQNFLPNHKKSSENSNGKLDLQFNLDISSFGSSSSEKFRPASFDTFKNPEKPFKKLDFSFDLEKTKEIPKNPVPSSSSLKEINIDIENPTNLLNKGLISKNPKPLPEKVENTVTERSSFEGLRNIKNKPDQKEEILTEKPNIKKKFEPLSSFQSKPQKIQNSVFDKQTLTKPIENLRSKPEPVYKSLNLKHEVTKPKCQENVEIINKPFEQNKQVELKKGEPENSKSNELENKIVGKRQFLNKADAECLKRKNNLSSPIPNSRVHFFSSANKSIRLTPATRNETKGVSLRKEDFNYEETLRKIEELQKKIESIPRLSYEEVIENECDILKFEEELPRAILRLLRLKWLQLECINSILSEADPEFQEIITNYIEFEKALTNSN